MAHVGQKSGLGPTGRLSCLPRLLQFPLKLSALSHIDKMGDVMCQHTIHVLHRGKTQQYWKKLAIYFLDIQICAAITPGQQIVPIDLILIIFTRGEIL